MKVIKYPQDISKKEFYNGYAEKLMDCARLGIKSAFDIVLTPKSDTSWLRHFEVNLDNLVKYIVIESGGDIRGYLAWTGHDDEIHFYNMIIHPDFQRDGSTLRRLLKTFASDVKDGGYKKLIAYTNFKNDRMNRLLLKHGFEIRQSRGSRTEYSADIGVLMSRFK